MCCLVETVSDLSRSFVKPILNCKLTNTSQIEKSKSESETKLNKNMLSLLLALPPLPLPLSSASPPGPQPAPVGCFSWGPPSPLVELALAVHETNCFWSFYHDPFVNLSCHGRLERIKYLHRKFDFLSFMLQHTMLPHKAFSGSFNLKTLDCSFLLV